MSDQEYNDNIFSQESDEKNSWVSVISPSVQAKADNGVHAYSLGYQLEAGYYENSTDDNYIDHHLDADAEWELNQRHKLAVNAGYSATHEDRGTGFSQGTATFNNDSPDEFQEINLGANYTFGGIRTKGRLVTALEYLDVRFTNHRGQTRGRDREDIKLAETFYWDIGGSTDALFELAYTNVDYKNDPTSVSGSTDTLDNELVKALVGVTWLATGKTEGTVKFGYAEKNFDDSDRDDFSGFDWSVAVKWSPKAYSSLTINTGRRQDESNGSGDFIDGQDFGLVWKHAWSDRFNTQLSTNYSIEDYKGDVNKQEDDLLDYSLRVNYEMRRWLTLGTSFTYEERDSNQEGEDFTRNIVALHIEASL
ncbi:hypothetical protein GCM10022277_04300 [Litoribacillus peritrichatus]|uniref:Outer membrane beta-barrel protein n=2 Tax=Litoribacillus peritrichatus TaxID=718191 RepID=A0ABP7M156_9GAMM